MTGAPHVAGRPLRALQLLGLALLLGFAARLPMLLAQTRAIIAAQQPAPAHHGPTPLLAAPLLLARAAPSPDLPPPARLPPYRAPWSTLLPTPPVALASTAPPPAPASPAPAPLAPPSPAPGAHPAAPSDGFALATAAYASLAAGDRRAAAGLFTRAIAAAPTDPRAAAWQAQQARLETRWSGEAYALFRDGGRAGPTASPVLGGGQVGAGLAFTPDPLARRPLAAIARLNAATDNTTGPDSLQAAFGIRWKPVPAVTIAAERLVAIGANAINDWSLRIAAGAEGQHGRMEWSGYAEADALGNGDIFAGAQARAGLGVGIGKARLTAGAGTWASVQTGADNSHRVDVGPSLVARAPLGRVNLEIAVDWRFRVIGNAAPDSGPALTVSTSF